jgi:hypothetical protein
MDYVSSLHNVAFLKAIQGQFEIAEQFCEIANNIILKKANLSLDHAKCLSTWGTVLKM